MADFKKFTTTLIQLHFSSHKNRFLSRKKKKIKTAMSPAGEGTFTGTANWYWISIYKRMMHVSFV